MKSIKPKHLRVINLDLFLKYFYFLVRKLTCFLKIQFRYDYLKYFH